MHRNAAQQAHTGIAPDFLPQGTNSVRNVRKPRHHCGLLKIAVAVAVSHVIEAQDVKSERCQFPGETDKNPVCPEFLLKTGIAEDEAVATGDARGRTMKNAE